MDLTKAPQNQTIARLSTGLGVCTCSFFMPDNKHVLYAGTFQEQKVCPPKKCKTPEAQNDPLLNQFCALSVKLSVLFVLIFRQHQLHVGHLSRVRHLYRERVR